MTMIRRISKHATLSLFIAGGILGIARGNALAQAASSSAQSVSVASDTSSAPINGLYDALRAAQTSGKTAQQRAGIIAPAVDKAFDLEAVLRRSVGLRYNDLSPADRTRLLGSFRQFTIARYASTFKPGTNAVFKVMPQTRANPAGGQIVDTTIGGTTGDSTPVDYIMTSSPSGWKITDILLNGHISQVAAQRSDFGGALGQGGASGLASLLDHKTSLFLHD